MPPIWVGFGPKFSKQGSFFGRFSIKMARLSRNWGKLAQNRSFSAKIHHKVGMTASFGNKKRVTF